jgi:1,5-anhydro-D-fructose reductase (1,5-anhydro-D-mannitol-forming)
MSRSGPILDLLPQVGSVVNKLIGRPLAASAIAVRQGSWDLPPTTAGALPEDACMAVIRYSGEVLCQVDVGWSVPFARNGLEVHGTEGSLVATNVMRADPGGSVVLVDSAGDRQIPFPLHRDAYEVTLESFAAAVTDGGEPAISGLEGLRSLAVALAIKKSGRSGRTAVVETEPPGNAPL